jgi:hypothetical protein
MDRDHMPSFVMAASASHWAPDTPAEQMRLAYMLDHFSDCSRKNGRKVGCDGCVDLQVQSS